MSEGSERPEVNGLGIPMILLVALPILFVVIVWACDGELFMRLTESALSIA